MAERWPRWSCALLIIGFASIGHAEIITAASCSRADVGQAVDRAVSGDEVVIPAQTCDWTSTLRITRAITLRGADRAGTVLRDGVPKDGSSDTTYLVFVENVSGVRLSTFTIEGLAEDTANNNHGHVHFEGDVTNSRVDHVTFRGLKNAGVTFSGHPTGVVDHCSFDGDHEEAVWVSHESWDGGGYGDSSWASPPTLGSADALYVEDCEVIDRAMNGAGALVVLSGGRAVLRHSVLTNDGVFVAGTESSGRFRSGRHAEVYANRFVTIGQFSAIEIAGGTGVVFDNVFEGAWTSLVRLRVGRSQGAFAPWGRCNGSNGFDQNSQPSGYACLDQVGRGEGALISGDTPSPTAWPQQVLDPVRLWNNESDAGVPLVTVVTPAVIAAGRDYLEGGARPGYQPFTYPHPLVARDDRDAGAGGVTDGGVGMASWRLLGCEGTGSGLLAPIGLLFLLVAARRR